MSRLKNNEEYEKTRAYKFLRWMSGAKDPYLGNVEMKVQEEHIPPSNDTVAERTRERQMMKESVYDVSQNAVQKKFRFMYRLVALLFCAFMVFMLLYTVSWLPPTGEAAKAVNNEVTERYIESGLQETGAVNIVTGMILDYRAFDTLGESHVLFVATITVLVLLHLTKSKEAKAESLKDSRFEPEDDPILQMGARALVPIIVIFGIYVILNGHISPGGGFSGGAIIGSALILYVSAFGFEKTEKFFTEKTYKAISFFALATYCIAKSYSFYMGANHLNSHIPLGRPGAILSSGLILLLNICVGLVVSCTMYTFYAMFRKGDF